MANRSETKYQKLGEYKNTKQASRRKCQKVGKKGDNVKKQPKKAKKSKSRQVGVSENPEHRTEYNIELNINLYNMSTYIISQQKGLATQST